MTLREKIKLQKNITLCYEKKELEAALRKLGWFLDRNEKKHDVWTNGKKVYNTIPRHQEINEFTAKGILRKASLNNGEKDGN